MSRDVITALGEAIDGLLYMSESDEPFEVVHWEAGDRGLDERKILELSGHQLDAPIKTLSLDSFFATLTEEQDWYGENEKKDLRRYRNLHDLIKLHLSDAKVFHVGVIKVDIYIVGRTREGDWAGVKTKSVET
jgi:hypothetical protein